jgi:hypothetical protein
LSILVTQPAFVELPMHLLFSLVLIVGLCCLLLFALLSVLHDSMSRDFHAPPMMTERDPYGDRRRPIAKPANRPKSAQIHPTSAHIEEPGLRVSGGRRR